MHSSWLNWAFTKKSYAMARPLFRERYSPVEVRPGQTPAHFRPLIPYTTTRDTIEADGAACEFQQGLVELGSAFIADAKPFELMEPGEGALDDPTGLAQAGAVGDAASGDEGLDAALPEQAAVLVEVVAAIGKQPFRSVAGSPPQFLYRWNGLQQRYELGDVVPVAAGHRDGEGCAVPVDDHMVLGPGAAAVDGRGPDVIPPFRARMCEPSIAQSSLRRRGAKGLGRLGRGRTWFGSAGSGRGSPGVC